MSGSQRAWVASGALAAIVASGYLGLMPVLSSSMSAAPEWPAPLAEVASAKLVVARIDATPEARRAASGGGTIVRAAPTSGQKVTARKPAIRKGRRTPERRSLVRYTAPAATEQAPAVASPRADSTRPATPVRSATPAKRPPRPEAEIVPIDVPALAADEGAPAPDEDPGTAGSGG